MGIKKILKFEKENMPDFQWKFEKFMFAFLSVWLGASILTLIVSIVIGLISGDEGGFWYIPIIVWGIALAGMLIAFVVKFKNLKSKLFRYHLDNISHEFYYIDYLEARHNIIEYKKLTDNDFIVLADDFNEIQAVPFEQVKIYFNPHFFGGVLILEIVLTDKNNVLFNDRLDNNYYNFLIRHVDQILNKPVFELFDKDKGKFISMLIKYNNAVKIEKKLKTV